MWTVYSSYVGETRRHFISRICEHKGISPRTNVPFANPLFSNIREHALNCNHPIKIDKFSVLARCQDYDLKGCLDWDSFATFLRLFSDADARVHKRRDSFALTQATQLCRVRRVGWPTHSRLLHGGVILRVRLQIPQREVITMAGSQLSRDSVLLLLEEWRQLYSMRFINCLRTLSLYFNIFLTYRAAY